MIIFLFFSKKCELDTTHYEELTEKKAPVWIIGGSDFYTITI